MSQLMASDLSSRPRLRLRVGFVSAGNLEEPNAYSGMPHRMRNLLARHHEVAPLHLMRSLASIDGVSVRRGRGLLRVLPRPIRRRGRAILSRLASRLNATYGRTLSRAEWISAQVQSQLDDSEHDVLFGSQASWALYRLRTGLPIVCSTDGTPRLIHENYPELHGLGRGFARACEEIEREALAQVSLAIYPYRRALESAVRDYGLPPERGLVIPMGAHITPTAAQLAALNPAPPSRGEIRLCIVASHPRRKRLAVAVEATEILARRGYNARLTYIGPPARAARSPRVESLGRLRLSDPRDRELHQQTLARSHLMLLPTLADGFPIAVCEAAHFGRPCIASDVGGLSEAILDGRTGILLPVTATAADYADTIAALVDDPDRYARISAAALQYARTTLNWDAWCASILEALDRMTRPLLAPQRGIRLAEESPAPSVPVGADERR